MDVPGFAATEGDAAVHARFSTEEKVSAAGEMVLTMIHAGP